MTKRKHITTMADLARSSLFNVKKGFDCTMVSDGDVEKTIRKTYIPSEIKELEKTPGTGVRVKFADNSPLFVPAWVVYADEVQDQEDPNEMTFTNFGLCGVCLFGMTYLMMGGPY